MNKQKLEKLFTTARKETAPAPPEDFAADVLRAIRNGSQIKVAETFSTFDQLNLLFPRFALASVALIALGIAADYGMTVAGVPDLSDGISQISSQWLF